MIELSKHISVDNFVKAIHNKFAKEWIGYDGENFKENKFFVDGTCLCKVTDDGVMYLSSNSLTPKCSLYIRELIMRAAEISDSVIYVPQWYSYDKRSHEFSESGIIMAFRARIFDLKDKRDIYSRTNMEETLSTLKKLSFIPADLIAEAEGILKKMTDAVRIEDKAVKKYISEHTYYEIVQAAYFRAGEHDIRFRTALKRYLNPSGEYAFLKYDAETDKVYSSECMCGLPKEVMTYEEAFAITKAYYEGTAKHGQKYGNYTIMRVMDGYIQVSCNKYCKPMFHALYEELLKHSTLKV